MKFLENPKLTGIALILLLALNSALLVVLVARKPAPRHEHPPIGQMPPPPMDGGGPKAMLIRELELDDAQQVKLDSMAMQHHTRMEMLNKQMKIVRDSLIGVISIPVPDSAKVKQLSARIGAKQAEIEQLNYWHFRDVRTMCTDEQKPRFDSVIHNALRMLGPHPGPPPPGPGGPPPMGPPPPHRPR